MRADLPVLLCDGSYYGTLAAARSLGRAGVEVTVADPSRLPLAGWSRFAARHVRCPSPGAGGAFVDWLETFGERAGQTVLYPTSDEVAFLVAGARERLARRFLLYQPTADTTLAILDKKRLLEAAHAAGIDVPHTAYPGDADEAGRLASNFDGPVMLKPRTQVLLRHHRKGAVAPNAAGDLRAEYARFVRDHHYGEPIASDPEIVRPMLQRYYVEAASWIYSLAGFRHGASGRVAMLGAVKVLQRPRRLGVGLCFEGAAVPAELRDAVTRLLAGLDYVGVFEIELVRARDRLLLIDMNPRFYNQMALDVARGLDLPRAAYAAAAGDDAEVERVLGQAPEDPPPAAFVNSIGMRLMISAQRALGTMSRADAAHWAAWVSERGRRVVDAVAADDDPRPYAVEAARQAFGTLRHPRAFVRMTALDR